MPNLAQAKKALRKSKKAFKRNELVRESIYKTKKAIRLAVEAKDNKKFEELGRTLQQIVDKAVKHNVIHRNRANRLKSRLTNRNRTK